MRQPLEVTTTTSSLTGSIPSPSPYTFAKTDARTSSTSSSTMFDYTSPYPLNHCVQPSTGLLTFDDFNLLCTNVLGLEDSLVKDDVLASLVVELGLQHMDKLPELKVGHHNLSDQDVWIVRQDS